MGKNLIPMIMESLGLENQDTFCIVNCEGYKFRFNGYVLQCLDTDTSVPEWICAEDAVLVELIYGDADIHNIIKRPFEPKCGEAYYTYAPSPSGRKWEVYKNIWKDNSFDFMFKATGCVFQTEKMALDARPAKYKELTGEDWESDE